MQYIHQYAPPMHYKSQYASPYAQYTSICNIYTTPCAQYTSKCITMCTIYIKMHHYVHNIPQYASQYAQYFFNMQPHMQHIPNMQYIPNMHHHMQCNISTCITICKSLSTRCWSQRSEKINIVSHNKCFVLGQELQDDQSHSSKQHFQLRWIYMFMQHQHQQLTINSWPRQRYGICTEVHTINLWDYFILMVLHFHTTFGIISSSWFTQDFRLISLSSPYQE